ncbi:MAG: hypothetical protein ACLTTP_08845 [Alistipes ihumii]
MKKKLYILLALARQVARFPRNASSNIGSRPDSTGAALPTFPAEIRKIKSYN